MKNRAAWIAAAAFWTLFGLLTGLQVWISMITHGHSVPRLLAYYVAIWIAWVGVTAIAAWLTRRWPVIPFSPLSVLVHLFAACVIALLHITYWIVLTAVMGPFDPMPVDWSGVDLSEIFSGRFPLELMLYAALTATLHAADYYAKYREQALEAAQLEASISSARLHALELQLQPHFLFNTLNAISSLVRAKRPDAAITMIAGLSDLLRYTLDHADEQQVALESELAMLERYLDIQRIRFGERMSFTLDVEPGSGRILVPTLILQPLAENAVRHGIARSASPGFVAFRAFRSDSRLVLEMSNSGALEEGRREGIGVQNTIDRLRQLYADAQSFELSDSAGIVTATITLPWVTRP